MERINSDGSETCMHQCTRDKLKSQNNSKQLSQGYI
jgi:hypothetical protein